MRLVLIKLGGGLITDKTTPLSTKPEVIKKLVKEIAQIQAKMPDLTLIIGNGAGSFGHYTVQKYALGTSGASAGKENQVAEVHKSVEQLNSIVAKALTHEGIKIKSVSGEEVFSNKVFLADSDVVPLVYGDILISNGQYKVVSTEEIFLHLLSQLSSQFKEINVILVTSVEGVLDKHGKVIAEIGSSHVGDWKDTQGYDVTGSMRQKLEMAQQMAKTADNVRIIGADQPNSLLRALQNKNVGTKVVFSVDSYS